jgi:histidinol phosphatase-like enzyme (inositol monophosphatase family)
MSASRPAAGRTRDIEQRLALALEAVDLAGKLTLEYFLRENYEVELKRDGSPVTEADRRAEEVLRQRILGTFPQDGVVGEELGEQSGSSAYSWVLDPIDGTKSFISGVPLYSMLIGILCDGAPLAGVIHIPALQETVSAAHGGGAWWQRCGALRKAARVSSRSLPNGLFLTSQVDSFAKRGAYEAYRQLEQTARVTRTWGDGYGYLLVATGRAEAIVDPEMNLWDAAALQPILEEAGGAFTDWQGVPSIERGEGVGCTLHVQPDVLGVTRNFPRRAVGG